MNYQQKYPGIIKNCTPFLFSYSENIESFKPLENTHIFEPTDNDSYDFFQLIKKMDSLSFTDSGMGMDDWVLLDCSIMPGGIFGFGLSKKDAPRDLLEKMGVPDSYQGLVPVSMFIAIPMANKTHWFGHNLSSLKRYLGDDFKGLGLMTKYYGVQCFQIKSFMGATQWSSDALFIHSALAPMKLKSAYTRIHSHDLSLIYESDYTHILEGSSLESLPRTEDVNISELDQIRVLDSRIKEGKDIYICGKPIMKDSQRFIPLHS